MSKKTPTRKKAASKKVEAEPEAAENQVAAVAEDVSPAESEPVSAPQVPVKTDPGPNTPRKATVEARLDEEIAVYTHKLRTSPHRSQGQKTMEAVLSVLQRVKGGN